jgi:hypothetical protein
MFCAPLVKLGFDKLQLVVADGRLFAQAWEQGVLS